MKKLIIIVSVILIIGISLTVIFITPKRIHLDEDQMITSFYLYHDTQKYSRTLMTIGTALDGRDYIYRFVVLDNDVSRFPENISSGVGLGIPSTECRVKILDDYNSNTGLVGREFTIKNLSHPQIQVYRMPRLVEGREYLMIAEGAEIFNNPSVPHGGMYFRIDEMDGVEYVYPYMVNCSSLDNKVPFVSDKEKSLYKEDTDWDVIQYIKKHDLDIPLFHEKFELNDFVAQISEEQEEKRK